MNVKNKHEYQEQSLINAKNKISLTYVKNKHECEEQSLMNVETNMNAKNKQINECYGQSLKNTTNKKNQNLWKRWVSYQLPPANEVVRR